jgi:cell division septation protein DedD
MTHDVAEDGFHEIQLSGKQLVFLFMSATIVLVFVFICGLLVGRSVRDTGPGEPGGAFAAGLPSGGETTSEPVAAAEPPAPAESEGTLTYHDELQRKNPRTEPVTPRVEAPPPPVPVEPAPRAAAPVEKPTPAARITPDVPTTGRPGTLVVQVFASQDLQAASSLVKRLAARGYPAFLVPPGANAAPPMYRVQVGRYTDRREAEAVSRRLEKEEQFSPWISSR